MSREWLIFVGVRLVELALAVSALAQNHTYTSAGFRFAGQMG